MDKGVKAFVVVHPPPVMATSAGSTHPTGMHSRFVFFCSVYIMLVIVKYNTKNLEM